MFLLVKTAAPSFPKVVQNIFLSQILTDFRKKNLEISLPAPFRFPCLTYQHCRTLKARVGREANDILVITTSIVDFLAKSKDLYCLILIFIKIHKIYCTYQGCHREFQEGKTTIKLAARPFKSRPPSLQCNAGILRQNYSRKCLMKQVLYFLI